MILVDSNAWIGHLRLADEILVGFGAADAGALIYSADAAVRKVWRQLGYRLALRSAGAHSR